MVTSKEIEVVMPTYNGSLYIEDQIKSIYNQTIRPIRLIVRDDSSTDGTKQLLLSLKSFYKSWLHILPSSYNIGCTSSINLLLAFTSAPYIALSDQDDIWLENKLELSILKMQKLESCYGKTSPVLIHSDLKLVDAELNDLNITYSSRQLLDLQKISSLSDLPHKCCHWMYYYDESFSIKLYTTYSVRSHHSRLVDCISSFILWSYKSSLFVSCFVSSTCF